MDGGVLGILYGLAVVFLASHMGAATLIATVITGQLVFSMVADHFGSVGFYLHRASPCRIVGCVFGTPAEQPACFTVKVGQANQPCRRKLTRSSEQCLLPAALTRVS
jgi:Putative inner membrane exporter, YdcZ